MEDHVYDDEPDPIEEEGGRAHIAGTPMHASPVGYDDGQRRAWERGWCSQADRFTGEIEDQHEDLWVYHLSGEHYLVDVEQGPTFFVAHRGLVQLHGCPGPVRYADVASDGEGHIHTVPEEDIPPREWGKAAAALGLGPGALITGR